MLLLEVRLRYGSDPEPGGTCTLQSLYALQRSLTVREPQLLANQLELSLPTFGSHS